MSEQSTNSEKNNSEKNNSEKDRLNNSDELEIKVAFLEDSITKLSDEFYLQQRTLDDLKAKYNALVNKVINKSGDDGLDTEILDERPPHY